MLARVLLHLCHAAKSAPARDNSGGGRAGATNTHIAATLLCEAREGSSEELKAKPPQTEGTDASDAQCRVPEPNGTRLGGGPV